MFFFTVRCKKAFLTISVWNARWKKAFLTIFVCWRLKCMKKHTGIFWTMIIMFTSNDEFQQELARIANS